MRTMDKNEGFFRTIIFNKKLLAYALSVMLISVLVFSVFYVSSETHHECSGEDCPICACINILGSNGRQLGSGLIPLSIATLMIIAFSVSITGGLAIIPNSTPVLNKVRMNS